MCFFFFKQKTAYEMRISDWSSDVCSSDLFVPRPAFIDALVSAAERGVEVRILVPGPHIDKGFVRTAGRAAYAELLEAGIRSEERRVGKECVVRVDPGGRRIIKKKKKTKHNTLYQRYQKQKTQITKT